MSVLTEAHILAKCKNARSLDSVKSINLWGQDLVDVRALAKLPLLEVISLSNNYLSSLSIFTHFTHVRELYLRKNNITDFQQLYFLQPLTLLSILIVSENPIASHPSYRAWILRILPRLIKLDDADVTPSEREAAVAAGDPLEDIQQSAPDLGALARDVPGQPPGRTRRHPPPSPSPAPVPNGNLSNHLDHFSGNVMQLKGEDAIRNAQCAPFDARLKRTELVAGAYDHVRLPLEVNAKSFAKETGATIPFPVPPGRLAEMYRNQDVPTLSPAHSLSHPSNAPKAFLDADAIPRTTESSDVPPRKLSNHSSTENGLFVSPVHIYEPASARQGKTSDRALSDVVKEPIRRDNNTPSLAAKKMDEKVHALRKKYGVLHTNEDVATKSTDSATPAMTSPEAEMYFQDRKSAPYRYVNPSRDSKWAQNTHPDQVNATIRQSNLPESSNNHRTLRVILDLLPTLDRLSLARIGDEADQLLRAENPTI